MKIKGKSSEDFRISVGYIVFDEDNKITTKPEEVENIHMFLKDAAKPYRVVDIIIHGMWSDIPLAWNDMMRKMSQIFNRSSSVGDATLTLSVIWDCALLYKNSIRIAQEKGEILADLLRPIFTPDRSINFVTHSMGNRVFHACFMKLPDDLEYHISRWFAISADLSKSEFEQVFQAKFKKIDKIYVYKHESDLTIKLSQLINKDDRLGVSGPEGTRENVLIVDGKRFDTDIDFITRLVKHRYFYESKAARDLLLEQLNK